LVEGRAIQQSKKRARFGKRALQEQKKRLALLELPLNSGVVFYLGRMHDSLGFIKVKITDFTTY
jgi:hypothetical protein